MDELLRQFTLLEGAANDLGLYRDYMERTGHADFAYPHAQHHKVMARALQRIANGELKRLIIQLPPGSAKSTITSIQFATWYWARFPTHHILRCSATDSLAKKFARRCQTAILTREWQKLSGTHIHAKQQAVESFANTVGGTMTAAGVGTSIIGLRSNLSILDDPVASFEQVNSDTQRQAMIDWYFAEYRSRLIPGGCEVIVTTRWRADDIVGFILESEEADTWEVIRIPMVCDADDDPLGREIGDRLWPEWFTPQMVIEARREPERWAGMYQQRPLSEKGDWLGPDDIPLVPAMPAGLGMYAALDIAMTEGKGDFTACVIAGMANDGNLYLVDLFVDRITPDQIVEKLIELHRTYRLREVLIDDDAGAKVFKILAQKILRQQRALVPLNPMPIRGQDKETRALAFRGLAKMGAVRMIRQPWNGEVLREITEFPFGKRDDIVDCLSLLGRRAAAMSGRATEPKQQREEVQGNFIHKDGMMHTRATLDDMWRDQVIRL